MAECGEPKTHPARQERAQRINPHEVAYVFPIIIFRWSSHTHRYRPDLANRAINHTDGGYIATHIRRGDRKAMSWRYQHTPTVQIPSSEYVGGVWRTYSQLQNISSADVTPSSPPLVYLATDSPSAASEFTESLTTNNSLVQKYGNDALKPVVYELRTSPDSELRSLAPQMEYVQAEWNNRTQADRIRETRGVIVDWALLSGAWMPKPSDDPTADAVGSLEVKPAASICALPCVSMCCMAPHVSLAK